MDQLLHTEQKLTIEELLLLLSANSEEINDLFTKEEVDFNVDELTRLNRHRRTILECIAEETAKMVGFTRGL